MPNPDTPGRPKSSSSRQQTQPDQGAQTGSDELDTKDTGSSEVQPKTLDKTGGSAAKQPNPRIAK